MAKADDWMARYHARQERQKQHSERLVEYLVPALRFLGVTLVSVEFDGYGDDGEIKDAVIDETPQAGLPEGLDGAIEAACSYALPGGWEINAGSCGIWFIDVEKGKSRLDIEYRDDDEDFDEDED